MLEKMMSQKELDKILPHYLEARLDQVEKARVNKLLTSLPEQKKLVEQLWANQQWMFEDRHHLLETAPTAPTKSEIRSLLENWEERTTTISSSPISWPDRNSQRKLIFKLAAWLNWPAFSALLIFVVAGAVLVSRNYFETISFSYSQDYLSILAIWFLAAIAVWLGIFIFRNHWKMLLPPRFNHQRQAGLDNRVSVTKVLKVPGTLLIWVELAGLIAALWWEAIPLYNFLTFYQISKEAKLLTITLSLLGVFWIGTELYRRRVNYNQTPAEWARNKLELLLSKRLYKIALMVTLALVLLVVAPFVVNTLVSDINNPDSLPTNLTTALATGPDNIFLPPTYPSEIGKVNYQIGPSAQIDPAVQNITTAPVYRQVVAPWKVEDAKGFAERMGFDSTSLHQDELADAYVFTTPQKGRLILSRKVKGLWSYASYSDDITSLPGDPINASPSAPNLTKDVHLDDQTGLNIAEKFLEGTTSLNLTYEYLTGNFNNTSFHPNYKGNTFQFLFGQTKNGQLIQGPTATVIIAADGTVEYAFSNLVALEKVDNYSLAGLDLTLQKLQDGDLPIYRSQLPPSNPLNSVNAQVVGNVNRSSSVDPAYGGGDKVTMPVSTSPNQTATTILLGPTYSIGQQVEINGDLDATIWRDPTGQQPDRMVVILHATKGATNYNFYLYGRDILAVSVKLFL